MKRHPVAFVGDKLIYDGFASMDDSWDLQIPLESLDDLERELSAPENEARISQNTNLIIFFSRLYRTNPRKFAKLVAYTAPYSVVCILIPDAERGEELDIRTSIQEEQKIMADSIGGEYTDKVPFYFVSYENAQSEIFDSIYKFTTSDNVSADIKEHIKTMLPEGNASIIDAFSDFEDEDEDEIIIPDKPQGNNSQVITVTSSKGGSGKSTVAMLIAAYIKKSSDQAALAGQIPKPLKVCMVDLDVRDGQLGFLNRTLSPSVVNIVASGEPNITNVKKGIYTNPKTKVDFLFAAKRAKNAREIPSSYYVGIIQTLRTMYDVVVLDTSVNYLDPLLEQVAYPMSDKVIFVSDFSSSSIYGMRRWIMESVVDGGGLGRVPRDKVKIVLNKVLKNVGMSVETIEKVADGLPIIATFPSAPSLVTYCSNVGSTDQILNSSAFNESTLDILRVIMPHEVLPPIPYID